MGRHNRDHTGRGGGGGCVACGGGGTSLARIVGRYVSLEMSLLWLTELVLSFLVIQAMLATTAAALLPALSARANFAALTACTIILSGVAIGLYRPETCLQRRRLLTSAGIAVGLAFPAILLLSRMWRIELNARVLAWIAGLLLVWTLCLLAIRWAFALAVRHRWFARRLIVVGAGARAARLAETLRSRPGSAFDLVRLPGGGEAGPGAQRPIDWRDVWGVVVAAEPGDVLPSSLLLEGKRSGVRVLDDVRFWEHHLGRIDIDHLGPDWLLFADGFVSSRYGALVKRITDIVVASLFLCLTCPVMAVAAVLIKLDSPGPLLYRQERVGLHGQTFTVLKFRSMRLDAEQGGTPRWAMARDPRVTRVGGFMRLTRIDELPQLFNVLRGEMSFVGPRPERPHFVEQLAQVLPLYRERSWVKPGITGWAQVNYPYGASVEDAREKLAYDLYYVKNRGLLLDLLIVVSTVRVIIFHDGAR